MTTRHPQHHKDPLVNFLMESNAIEGYHREVTDEELEAFRLLLSAPRVELPDELLTFQAQVAPGFPLRSQSDMNVQVGEHLAPPGGPLIEEDLRSLLQHILSYSPFQVHCKFLTLHPFLDGNGRTARALWAWHMVELCQDPCCRPFLQSFYYQTLAHHD